MKIASIVTLAILALQCPAWAKKDARKPAQTGHVGSFMKKLSKQSIDCMIEDLKLNASTKQYISTSGATLPVEFLFGTTVGDENETWILSGTTIQQGVAIISAQLVDNADLESVKKGAAALKVKKALVVAFDHKATPGQTAVTSDADGIVTKANRLSCTFPK